MRQYEPAMMRFGQHDVWRGYQTAPLSINRYLYVVNNPIGYIDPSGMLCKDFAKKYGSSSMIGQAIQLINKTANAMHQLALDASGNEQKTLFGKWMSYCSKYSDFLIGQMEILYWSARRSATKKINSGMERDQAILEACLEGFDGDEPNDAQYHFVKCSPVGKLEVITRTTMKRVDDVSRGDVVTVTSSLTQKGTYAAVTLKNGKTGSIEWKYLCKKRPPTYTDVFGADRNSLNVSNLQKALQYLYYYKGQIDGKYGDDTIKAVKAFQKDYDLEFEDLLVDGIPGPATLKVLFNRTYSNFDPS